MKKIRWAAISLLILVVLAQLLAPRVIESQFNKTLRRPPYQVSTAAQALHSRLLIADLHADSLLWKRDLLSRSSVGHVDIPRLQAGNVAIQAFTVVTKSPRGVNIRSNDTASDDITKLAMVELWPLRTWNSLLERALYQSERLNRISGKSKGELLILRSRRDLDELLARRSSDSKVTAALLGIEGAHALEGKLENLDHLYNAGYRMISPSHFFDTEIGGSSAGTRKIGLTPLGREWVKRMNEKHMIIDLAHASPSTIRDVTALTKHPVLVSHTGVKGTCDNNRNVSDDEIRAVARTGGVVGIGFWETAICGRDAAAIARAIRHASNVVGVDHVALGSDFDGTVTVPFDASGMALITEALLSQGFTESEIAKIMGGNVVRLLRTTLPD